MSYNVDWTDDGLNALAWAWLQAADRTAVNAAEKAIDQALASDPLEKGTPLSEGLYVIEIHPLRAQFEIDEVKRIVSIVSVAYRS